MQSPPEKPRTPWRLRNLDRRWRRLRRKVFEAFGDFRYSKCARGDLDEKLAQYLPERGFFVEAGANDGVSESNTYYLERAKGWRGVLVEPIPELYRKCVEERPRSIVFQCALVSDGYAEETIEMRTGHLLSLVRGSPGSPSRDHHADRARDLFGIEPRNVSVPARTLTSILEEVGAGEIDFLSLDVEGYEAEALEGLDFERFAPRFVLTESLGDRAGLELRSMLERRYRCHGELTDRDLLFERKD